MYSWVKHNLGFVHPMDPEVHTQTIEGTLSLSCTLTIIPIIASSFIITLNSILSLSFCRSSGYLGDLSWHVIDIYSIYDYYFQVSHP